MLESPFSAGMGFEIAFKVFCLFFRSDGNDGMNFPWGKLGSVRNMPGVMSSESGFQVGGMTDVEVSVGSCIPQDVGVVKAAHGIGAMWEEFGSSSIFVE